MNSPLLIDELLAVLEHIERLLPAEKQAWDRDVRTRLAIERLWITAGNVAEAHRLAVGLEAGDEPWAEIYRFRNLLAHALPGDLSSDRVWIETVTDLPRLLTALRSQG